MALKDKTNIVYVKKLFTLKDGTQKVSCSRYGFNTLQGARRCLFRMKSRCDVIECWIN